MTRCKVGDLAITEGAPMDNGLLVEVLSPYPEMTVLGPCWLIRSMGSPFHMELNRRAMQCVWLDIMLKPIRDPGDDAVDETLCRLPRVVEEVI